MFDLISSEYGWTDDQILDSTLERVLLARDSILQRKAANHRRELRIAELTAKAITGAVYAAAGDKKASEKADKVSFLPPSKKSSGPRRVASTEAVMARFGAPEWGEERADAERRGERPLPGDS